MKLNKVELEQNLNWNGTRTSAMNRTCMKQYRNMSGHRELEIAIEQSLKTESKAILRTNRNAMLRTDSRTDRT